MNYIAFIKSHWLYVTSQLDFNSPSGTREFILRIKCRRDGQKLALWSRQPKQAKQNKYNKKTKIKG